MPRSGIPPWIEQVGDATVEVLQNVVEQQVGVDRHIRQAGRARWRPPGSPDPALRRALRGQPTLRPRPTTTAGSVFVAPVIASASTPASFRSSTTRSFGHLRPGSTPAMSLQASAAARASSERAGMSCGRGQLPGTQAAPRRAGLPPAERPTSYRAVLFLRSGTRRPRPDREAPRGELRQPDTCSWSRSRRIGGSGRDRIGTCANPTGRASLVGRSN